METSIHNSSKTNIHCCPTIMEEKLFESSFFKFYNEWTDLCICSQGKYDKKEYKKDAGEMNHKWLVWS